MFQSDIELSKSVVAIISTGKLSRDYTNLPVINLMPPPANILTEVIWSSDMLNSAH